MSALKIGDPLRPYIKDEVDEVAAAMYAKRGFNPPERPNGFLDEQEAASWARWREAASSDLKPSPTAPPAI